MTLRAWFVALFLAAVTTSLPAQRSAPDAPVDRYIQETMAARHIPGLALAVMRNGKIAVWQVF